MKNKQIIVLYGGKSNEREVSLRSGKNILDALKSVDVPVSLIDTAEPTFNLRQACHNAAGVIIALHGAGGEDGVLQRQLDELGVPYVGSGPVACELTFNKAKAKELLVENGILTPNWEVVDRQQFAVSGLRRSSYVLKPIMGGSSIDTVFVHNPAHQIIDPQVFDELFNRYGKMLLEELVEGHELTVGVVGEQALPVILIVPPIGEEFNYDNKYNGRTQEIVAPEHISSEYQKQAQELALRAHQLAGCRHISRTDMIIAENGAIYTLEVNAIPGMTKQSLLPQAAQAAGIDMAQLAQLFVKFLGV